MAVRNRNAPFAFERPARASAGIPREPASRKRRGSQQFSTVHGVLHGEMGRLAQPAIKLETGS